MMKKKIFIASLFVTLILLVPMTSVVGVSDVEENCGCKVISSRNMVRVERLLSRLEVYINVILLRFGYIPEVVEKYYEILYVINSNRQLDNSIICDILEPIFLQLEYICDTLHEYYLNLVNNESKPIIARIISAILLPISSIYVLIAIFGDMVGCWDW